VYHRIAADSRRVRVTNEGNVVPWLKAARLLIHNGCTTGVEAYAMRVPAVSYRPKVDDNYDMGFYRLPNLLSHQCFDYDSLRRTVKKILAGDLKAANGEERRALVDRHLAALDGPLACERMVDALAELAKDRAGCHKPNFAKRTTGRILARSRTMVKRYKDARPGDHNRPEFQKHRFPPLALEDIKGRVTRFRSITGVLQSINIQKMQHQFYLIGPAD
jgi:hypothetical protein